MVARLQNAELQQFLEEAVRAGRYPSVDAAIEAAVWQMKREDDSLPPLDEETLDAIDQAEASHDRGESRPWAEVRAELLAKVEGARR